MTESAKYIKVTCPKCGEKLMVPQPLKKIVYTPEQEEQIKQRLRDTGHLE